MSLAQHECIQSGVETDAMPPLKSRVITQHCHVKWQSIKFGLSSTLAEDLILSMTQAEHWPLPMMLNCFAFTSLPEARLKPCA